MEVLNFSSRRSDAYFYRKEGLYGVENILVLHLRSSTCVRSFLEDQGHLPELVS